MKKKNKSTIVAVILVLAVLSGGIYAAYRNTLGSSDPIPVTMVSNIAEDSSWYDYGDSESYGIIVSMDTQEVVADSDYTIETVYVQIDDEVKEGDALLKYDMTLQQLQMEMAQLNYQTQELALEKNERTLEKLMKYSGAAAIAARIDEMLSQKTGSADLLIENDEGETEAETKAQPDLIEETAGSSEKDNAFNDVPLIQDDDDTTIIYHGFTFPDPDEGEPESESEDEDVESVSEGLEPDDMSEPVSEDESRSESAGGVETDAQTENAGITEADAQTERAGVTEANAQTESAGAADTDALTESADSAETAVTEAAPSITEPAADSEGTKAPAETALSEAGSEPAETAFTEAEATEQLTGADTAEAVSGMTEAAPTEAGSEPAETAVTEAGSEPAKTAVTEAGSEPAETAATETGSQMTETAVTEAGTETATEPATIEGESEAAATEAATEAPAEGTESVTETQDISTEETEAGAEAAESVSEAAESVSEAAESVTEAYEPAAEAVESVTEAYESVTESPADPEDVPEYTEFEAEQQIDGVTIRVTADAGVFPEGSVLQVAAAADEEAAGEAVDEVRGEDRHVVRSYSYDLSILDADGQTIQPDSSRGEVTITFTMDEVNNVNLQAEVYHVDDAMDASALTAEVNEEDGSVSVRTDSFSVYTVEFTYGSLEYVIDGGQSVALSDTLAAVGLKVDEDTVTEVVSSDESLLSVSQDEEGRWVLTSLQPFDTDEALTVTADGTAYEITVTDSQEEEEGVDLSTFVNESMYGYTNYKDKTATSASAAAGGEEAAEDSIDEALLSRVNEFLLLESYMRSIYTSDASKLTESDIESAMQIFKNELSAEPSSQKGTIDTFTDALKQKRSENLYMLSSSVLNMLQQIAESDSEGYSANETKKALYQAFANVCIYNLVYRMNVVYSALAELDKTVDTADETTVTVLKEQISAAVNAYYQFAANWNRYKQVLKYVVAAESAGSEVVQELAQALDGTDADNVDGLIEALRARLTEEGETRALNKLNQGLASIDSLDESYNAILANYSGSLVNLPDASDGDLSKLLKLLRQTMVVEETESASEVTSEDYSENFGEENYGFDDYTGTDTGDDDAMTKEELEEQILTVKTAIMENNWSLREYEIELKKYQRILDGETVRAQMDGIVMDASSVDGGDSDALFVISGSGGLYVQGLLNELELDTIQVGDTISGTCEETSMPFTATVTEISDQPVGEDSSYSYYYFSFGYENQNSSKYLFTAKIDDPTDIMEGYAMISTGSTGEESGSGLYISAMLVRTDNNNGRSYVYIQGSDGLLKKQYVTTGSNDGFTIQVTSGLKQSDFIAFPYGSDVKEGAKTVISDSIYE